MEDRETARMRKYGESKTARIMMATVPHVASGFGLRNFRPMDFGWHECTFEEAEVWVDPRAGLDVGPFCQQPEWRMGIASVKFEVLIEVTVKLTVLWDGMWRSVVFSGCSG